MSIIGRLVTYLSCWNMVRLDKMTCKTPVGRHVQFLLLFCIFLPTKSLISRFTLGAKIRQYSSVLSSRLTPSPCTKPNTIPSVLSCMHLIWCWIPSPISFLILLYFFQFPSLGFRSVFLFCCFHCILASFFLLELVVLMLRTLFIFTFFFWFSVNMHILLLYIRRKISMKYQNKYIGTLYVNEMCSHPC